MKTEAFILDFMVLQVTYVAYLLATPISSASYVVNCFYTYVLNCIMYRVGVGDHIGI